MNKCIETDCNNERMKNKTYCSDCESFVLSEKEKNKINKLFDKAQNQTLELKDMEDHELKGFEEIEQYSCFNCHNIRGLMFRERKTNNYYCDECLEELEK